MNLHNIQLILKREYLQRVRSPGFIIGTIVGILGLLALSFVPTLLNLLNQSTTIKVAVVDPHNLVYPYLEVLSRPTPTPVPSESNGASSATAGLPLTQSIKFSKADTADTAVLDSRVNKGDIDAYLLVNGDKPSSATFTYHAKDRPSALASAQLNAYLSAALTQGKLQEFGITPQQAQALFSPPQLTAQPVQGATFKDEKTAFNSVALAYVLLILLYVTILLYGVQVAMGVVEEKSSRVMELLITAVRPIELMAGKVVGIGLVGLTQYALWGLALLAGGFLGGAAKSTGIDVASIPLATLLSFLVFFLLGYLLFAAMYAALGSLVNKTEDVNSVTAPLTIVMVGVYLVSIYALSSPDAGFVHVLSFVPFFTPMLMFIRVALGGVAIWEFVLSVIMVAVSSYLLTWLAAKIYRVGVLLYGKRPSVREITRLLRTT